MPFRSLPPILQACDVLAAVADEGSLPGAPSISNSIAARAVPFEADADLAEPSADGEATGACRSQQMSRALHGSAGAAEDVSGMLTRDSGAAQATSNAQPRGSALHSSAADSKDASQCLCRSAIWHRFLKSLSQSWQIWLRLAGRESLKQACTGPCQAVLARRAPGSRCWPADWASTGP